MGFFLMLILLHFRGVDQNFVSIITNKVITLVNNIFPKRGASLIIS